MFYPSFRGGSSVLCRSRYKLPLLLRWLSGAVHHCVGLYYPKLRSTKRNNYKRIRCKTYFFRVEIYGLPNTSPPNALLHIPIRMRHEELATLANLLLARPRSALAPTGYVTEESCNSNINNLITRLKIGYTIPPVNKK